MQKRYSKDSFIAHIGGDDFFVGLKNKDKEDVFELTSNVQDEFRNSAKNIYSKEDKKMVLLSQKIDSMKKEDLNYYLFQLRL